jgi:septum formation protein
LTILNMRDTETVIVGADTVIFADGKVLDKPLFTDPHVADTDAIQQAAQNARQMLTALRSRTFHVITGLVIATTQGNRLETTKSCCVVSQATMKPFDDQDIERYIQTGEPLDKAGAFGIQERGVALFESIEGSYSNIVGLPLAELITLLRESPFYERVDFPIGKINFSDNSSVPRGAPALSVVSAGDINFDLIYTQFPAGFFVSMNPPGQHVQGEIYRAAGGTAVIFAKRAKEAGFKTSSVLGVIGGDALGTAIMDELAQNNIPLVLVPDPNRQTSIAMVLRDGNLPDTTLTLTDARQELSVEQAKKARPDVEQADVLFVSGYCLTDPSRRQAAIQLMEWAKAAGQLVVLDATVDMDKAFDFAEFVRLTQRRVDVLVAEIATLVPWTGEGNWHENNWDYIREHLLPLLHQHFPTVFLRTSTYTHEIISSPSGIHGPEELDYARLPVEQRLGYADALTARHLYDYMSPRLLLASASPRRFELLKQIVAANKVEVQVSDHKEEYVEGEPPIKRVQRLALEKARQVLAAKNFSPSIEIIIGADTEIVLQNEQGLDEEVGHPHNAAEAREALRKLAGKTHQAITGLALIGTRLDPATGGHKEKATVVSTQVTFRNLSDTEIEEYVQSGEPINKAGAYGIQGKGALLIERIEGSYSNVVGLPLECLSAVLSQGFGLPIWDIDKVSHWTFSTRHGGTP